MFFELLHDWRLLFICALSGVVSLLTSSTVASRPAAVTTKRVAMSVTMFNIFFMMTRFANLFYLPILASYVDRAVRAGNLAPLLIQFRIVAGGAAVGALLCGLFLPTFIEIYTRGIRSLEHRGSMVTALLRMLLPANWGKLVSSLRKPSALGVSLFKLEGVPPGFLIFNIFASAIWTVGVLCAMYVSAQHPEYSRTSLLLSGLVNAVAAILFSAFVDPKAALITDQAIAGERSVKHVYITTVFLLAGSFIGAILGQLFLIPGISVIEFATLWLSHRMSAPSQALLIVFFTAVLVNILASTAVVSRISAVITGRVATAIAVYNLFFLVTRLAQQVYAPIVGSIVDMTLKAGNVDLLEEKLRIIILGSTAGAILGWLLMPTFIEVYRKAIGGMEKFGSMHALILQSLKPGNWKHWIACLRKPGFLGVKFSEMKEIPGGFLVSNILVVSIYTVGVMAATYASSLNPDFERTATLLSSVVNGVATILISLVVDPMSALITDEAVAKKRPLHHVEIMAVFLLAGTILGTLLSQLIFKPSVEIIALCSRFITELFGR